VLMMWPVDTRKTWGNALLKAFTTLVDAQLRILRILQTNPFLW
jgi:hypothetical protein